jgi:predicted alpha/beta superfamily hydrolase
MKSPALRYILAGVLAGALITAALAFLFTRQQAPDAPPRAASVADLARFETFGLALPTLGVDRSVRVYLPPGYSDCKDCRYPVVYFMDGQNVFDAATSYAGEWGADEVLDGLHEKHGLAVIAVALDHGGEARMQELSVWTNPEFAPAKGEAYLADLIGAVKPAVDARYRTQLDASATVVAGSSMGGLMAHAAVMRHPEVFGRALVFSPSYWFSPAIAQETTRTPLQPGQRVYIYVGGSEGSGMQSDAEAMEKRWKATLPDNAALRITVTAAAGHNEDAWRTALPDALCWSFAPACGSEKPAP